VSPGGTHDRVRRIFRREILVPADLDDRPVALEDRTVLDHADVGATGGSGDDVLAANQ